MTLTKGPAGVLFAACGFVAAFRRDTRLEHGGSRVRDVLLPGLPLFFLLAGGWLLLAWMALGPPVFDKIMVRELAGHAVGDGGGVPWDFGRFFTGLTRPFLYSCARFAPWSALALWACIELWRRRTGGTSGRRAEWFFFWMLAGGLLLLGLARHRRPDLIFPLLPAAALLAGNVLAGRWLREVTGRLLAGACAFSLAVLAVSGWYYGRWRAAENPLVRKSAEIELVANAIRDMVHPPEPVIWVFMDTPYGLLFHLNRMQFRVTPKEAAGYLALPIPVVVVVQDSLALLRQLPVMTDAWPVWSSPRGGGVQIWANRRREWFDQPTLVKDTSVTPEVPQTLELKVQ